jgi:glycosyltransferase involved in cell wall biosynthesis
MDYSPGVTTHHGPAVAQRHVALLSWRDTRNPEGGGAERFLEKMAEGLVARGSRVTVFCAAYAGAAPQETVDGVRYIRRGSKMSVYLWGMLLLLTGRLGRVDVVVDVQNGLPFFSRLVTRKPVIVLVHHVHREQWPVVYPGLTGRVGWWIEHSLAPRLYRHSQYVAVSRATRAELAQLGVDPGRVAVVHNGTDRLVRVEVVKTPYPSICVVGRLVPHKQVEHAITAALHLREQFPDLRLTVVGSGWWAARLSEYAEEVGASSFVEFTGHVEEVRKQEIYERSWVMALPSIKEGWGLVVGEAAMHGTPTVAYRSAGGTRESIDNEVSGLLVDTLPEFIEALRRVISDREAREKLAEGARTHSGRFTWEHSQAAFTHVVASAISGEVVASQDEVTDEDQLLEP